MNSELDKRFCGFSVWSIIIIFIFNLKSRFRDLSSNSHPSGVSCMRHSVKNRTKCSHFSCSYQDLLYFLIFLDIPLYFKSNFSIKLLKIRVLKRKPPIKDIKSALCYTISWFSGLLCRKNYTVYSYNVSQKFYNVKNGTDYYYFLAWINKYRYKHGIFGNREENGETLVKS